MKAKVLYILDRFPISMESYVVTEIAHVRDHVDTHVVSFGTHTDPVAKVDIDYELIDGEDRLDEIIKAFEPDILHGHFLETIELIHAASARHGIPYSIRSHSYDVADQRLFERLGEFSALANHDLCLGILAFPYVRPRLEEAGFRPDKITDTGPVFWFDKFYDPTPREPTGRILAMGSAWPKKNFEAVIDIAPSLPSLQIDIYAAGGMLSDLKQYNERKGSPATFVPHVPFDDMPAVYRNYDWYIYTGKTDQCGMPISVLEAQAAGTGVLYQYTRPEDRPFVNGAGVVFEEVDEVVDIVANGYPAEMRARGYENARRWDIKRHIGDITSLWYDHLDGKADRIGRSFAKDFRQSFWSRLRNRKPEQVPVYVIHLSRNFDRHVHLCETLLAKLGAAEVIAAYDGVKSEPLPAGRKEGIKVAVDDYADYTPEKLACSLSHLKACRKLLATGATYGVILEDDVDVADDFHERLRHILERTPDDFDVVHLFVHPEYAPALREEAAGRDDAVIRYAPTWGRCAYVVSRAGARKIIKGFRDVKYHGDIQMADMSANDKLNVYCATEKIVDNLRQLYGDYRGERFQSNLHSELLD